MEELLMGARPSPEEEREPGEWAHGWQFWASKAREQHAREHIIMPAMSDSCQALLRSQSGPCSGKLFALVPTSEILQVPADEFRVLLLRRLRTNIPLTERRCRCGRSLDSLGDHRAACSNAGVLKRRGAPLEKAAARICREAGARVQENVFARDLNLDS
eukprot:2909564-Karenia_brevis.AAC.1